MSYNLRDYQNEAISTMRNLESGRSGVIALPTGSGKTVIFSDLSSKIDGRVLIVVPSKELREQAIEKLKAIDKDIDVGSVQANLDEVDSRIVVATRQSLTHKKSNRLERMIDSGKFEVVIIDECHNAVGQIKIIKENINSDVKFIGFTATPYNPDMNMVFDNIIYEKSLLDMIQEGYLCQPKAIYVHSDVDLSSVKTVAGEFNQKQLEEAVNTTDRNKLLVEAYKKYAKDRKSTIVFASGIDHSNEIANVFRDNNIKCKSIDSTVDDKTRDSIIDEFKSGKLPVIVNVGILTTGFDSPRVDCIMFARPTKSKILYTQILGRGLRNYEGKEDCLMIDVVDVMKKHDLVTISDIFGLPIKEGETPLQAKENRENERLEYEAEMKRKQEEKLRLMEEQIELFRVNMGLHFSEAYYDWFKCSEDTYAISENSDNHYVIERIETGFLVYKVIYNKEIKEIEVINEGRNLIELIDFVENESIKRFTSFSQKNARWKLDSATPAQRQWSPKSRTKWDVHLDFTPKNIKKMIWQHKKEMVTN